MSKVVRKTVACSLLAYALMLFFPAINAITKSRELMSAKLDPLNLLITVFVASVIAQLALTALLGVSLGRSIAIMAKVYLCAQDSDQAVQLPVIKALTITGLIVSAILAVGMAVLLDDAQSLWASYAALALHLIFVIVARLLIKWDEVMAKRKDTADAATELHN